MNYKLLFIVLIPMVVNPKDLIIKNTGESSSVLVYNSTNQTSAALHPILNPESENGGCLKIRNTGQPITIIFEEDLGQFNLINSGCDATVYTSSCPLLTDSTVVYNQSYISNEAVSYNSVTSSNAPQSQKFDPLPISPICLDVAAYLIKNFGKTGEDYRIAEFASGNPNAHSFCSVTMSFDDQDDLYLGINPSELFYSNKTIHSGCEISNGDSDATCYFEERDGYHVKRESCVFSLQDLNSGFVCSSGYSGNCKPETQNNGSILYSCLTTGFKNNYVCNIVTNSNGYGIAQAKCNFDPSLVVSAFSNGFYCGACGNNELSSVGNGPYAFIEDDLYKYLYPFAANQATNSCDTCFMAEL